MFDGEIVKKKFTFKNILSRISSTLFLFVSDLSMLIITKLSIQTATTISLTIHFVLLHVISYCRSAFLEMRNLNLNSTIENA